MYFKVLSHEWRTLEKKDKRGSGRYKVFKADSKGMRFGWDKEQGYERKMWEEEEMTKTKRQKYKVS